MSKITDLYEKEQFQEVIKLENDAKETQEMVSVIFSYMSLDDYKSALNYLLKHKQELYEKVPDLVIQTHISLLCGLYQFDDAYIVAREYQDMPYVSQVVEEVLRNLNKQIREVEIAFYRDSSIVSDDQVRKMIKSEDPEDVVGAISYIRDRGVDKFMNEIQSILLEFPKQSVRSLYLVMLLENGYDKEVEFNRFGEKIKVVPNTVPNPIKDNYDKKMEMIASFCDKDITVKETAEKIFVQYSLAMLPVGIDINERITFQAIASIAKQYLYKKPVLDKLVFAKMQEIIKAISE